jgi:hypothetical protein
MLVFSELPVAMWQILLRTRGTWWDQQGDVTKIENEVTGISKSCLGEMVLVW